jgi:hypothetical protein
MGAVSVFRASQERAEHVARATRQVRQRGRRERIRLVVQFVVPQVRRVERLKVLFDEHGLLLGMIRSLALSSIFAGCHDIFQITRSPRNLEQEMTKELLSRILTC